MYKNLGEESKMEFLNNRERACFHFLNSTAPFNFWGI